MAIFRKFFPVILLFSLLDLLYCAPYIKSSEHFAQYLTDSIDPVLSYLRKRSTHGANNANYGNQEQQVDAPGTASVIHNQNDSQPYNNGDTTTADSIAEKNIRNTFSFIPFLQIFENTSHQNSYTGQMIADQPDPSSSLPTISSFSDKGKKETFATLQAVPYTVDTNDCVKNDEKSGKPFCTELRSYPEKSHLDTIIETKFSNLETFFGEDLLPPQNISQRIDDKPIEESLCRSRTRVIYPEAGINKNYDWMFIINTKKYKQGIRIEECIYEGSTCGEDIGLTLPNRYKATCKQYYNYRSLVAFANTTIIKDQFKMPSCCKCVLTVF